MWLTLLKGKLHRPAVTDIQLNYEGSIAIDALLLQAAGIRAHEQVHVYNTANGERWTTYAITAPAGSGTVSVNGAAARKALPGDRIIVAAYAQFTPEEADAWQPIVVHVDAHNHLEAVVLPVEPPAG